MKQVFLAACAIIMVAFSASVFAQATASATATATIVAPIAISNAGDMNFGNVAVINAGTVTLKPSDAQTLYVGATLNVATAQVAGVYTNATGFDVTVNYN